MFHKVKTHVSNFKHVVTRIIILHILLRFSWYKQATYSFPAFFHGA